MVEIDLKGRPLYKISVGEVQRRAAKLLPEFRNRRWAVMHAETGQGRGHVFESGIQVGDYIYLCQGSDELWEIGRVTTPSMLLPLAINNFDSQAPWLYREYEIIAKPIKAHPGVFSNASKWSPSGNSALGIVNDFAEANRVLFEPYYNCRLVNGNTNKGPKSPKRRWARQQSNICFIQPGADGELWAEFQEQNLARIAPAASETIQSAFKELQADDVLIATTRYDQALGIGLVVKPPSGPNDLMCEVKWLIPKPAEMGRNTFLVGVAFGRTHQWKRIRKAYETQYPELKGILNQYFPSTDIKLTTQNMVAYPLNQILYGPPGTGKTYATAAWAVALIEGREYESVEAEYRYKQKVLQELLAGYKERGQVRFVTFHQSFSYEDFVEGIKPKLDDTELRYRIEAGVFQAISLDARRALLHPNEAVAMVAKADFETVYAAYVVHLREQLKTNSTVPIQTMYGNEANILGLKDGDSIVVSHKDSPYKPAVARKWTAEVYRRYERAEDIIPMNQKMLEIGGPNASLQWALFRDLKKFESAQFPAEANPEAEELALVPAVDGLARFVLIVDEINRGNVASIFGELITLLEDDKRAGELNELAVTLPYSKTTFSVPRNLYLLGTMNTADRSVEALDTALRRRFSFVETPPRPELLSPAEMIARLWWKFETKSWDEESYKQAEQNLFELLGRQEKGASQDGQWEQLQTGTSPGQIFASDLFSGLNLERLLNALNQRLEYLLGREARMGHAWLMSVGSLKDLEQAFRNKVIPQLQEYFYGNWGRIGQVLGPKFIEKTSGGESPLIAFEGEDDSNGRELYKIREGNWTLSDFQSIYQ